MQGVGAIIVGAIGFFGFLLLNLPNIAIQLLMLILKLFDDSAQLQMFCLVWSTRELLLLRRICPIRRAELIYL